MPKLPYFIGPYEANIKSKDYAKKHGYDFRFDLHGEGFWHKYVMFENLIDENKYDWIFWIDYDSIITNTSVKLENLISKSLALSQKPELIDAILTPDWYVSRSPPPVYSFLPYIKPKLTHPFATKKTVSLSTPA